MINQLVQQAQSDEFERLVLLMLKHAEKVGESGGDDVVDLAEDLLVVFGASDFLGIGDVLLLADYLGE